MQSSDIIQPTAIQAPFAVNGDKNIPNYNATGTETSSLNLGFLPITSQALDDDGQAPEREDFNGMFYLSTDLRVFLQDGGFITYRDDVATAIGGYPKGAILGFKNASGFGFVESLKENNQNTNFNTNPAYIDGTNWKYVHLLNIDTDIATVNATIASVQSNLQGQITINKNNIATNKTNITTAQNTANNALSVANSKATVSYNPGTYGWMKVLKPGTSNYIILNWGDIETTSDSYKTVTFSAPYQNTSAYQIFATIRNTGDTDWAAATYRVSASQARIYANSQKVSWFAIGS